MIPLDKPELRARLRAERAAYAASLDGATRTANEQALADVLAPLFATARIVAGYAPMRAEISPLPALERAAAAGLTVAFPHFADRDSPMLFRSGDPVERGPWKILQPSEDAPIVAPDLVLLPLIGIDRAGNRIGMGKGHYDRALPRLREAGARLVGVGWRFQRVDQRIPPDPWDLPLDAFASPGGLENFR